MARVSHAIQPLSCNSWCSTPGARIHDTAASHQARTAWYLFTDAVVIVIFKYGIFPPLTPHWGLNVPLNIPEAFNAIVVSPKRVSECRCTAGIRLRTGRSPRWRIRLSSNMV